MANEERGEVDFAVGERSYTLVLSMNAIAEMEARTKKTYGQLVASMSALDITALRDIFWMTLKKHHAKTFDTAAKVGDLIDEAGGPNAAVRALDRLFELNRKKKDDDDPSDPQAAQI